MSTTGNLRLAFVIEAIDRATATVGRVNKVIDRVTEPVRRVRAATQALVRESRFERVQAAWANLGAAGQKFTGWVRGAAGGVAALAFAAAGAGYALKRNFDAVDSMSDQAQKLGITTQAFQALGFAAKQSGSDQGQMAQALQFLSENMVEAINGSQEMQAWFSRVGLSSAQLAKMNVQQVLERVADVFERLGDSGLVASEKIKFARAVMGRGGADMIQLLNNGGAGMRDLYEEAQRMGVVLSTDVVQRIRKFNDQVDVMSAATSSAFAEIGSEAIPVLAQVINGINDWIRTNKALIGSKLAEFMNELQPKLPAIARGVWDLVSALGSMAMGINTVVQWIGGWNTVLAIGAAIIVGKAVVAVYTLTTALWGLAAAFVATPFGVVVAGIAGVVAIGTVLYKTFKPVQELFDAIWDTMKRVFGGGGAGGAFTNTPADGAPSIYASADEWARYRGTAGGGAPGMLAAAGATRADVSGRIRIEVDSQGKLRRFEAEGSKGIEFDGYAGVPMAGP